MFVDDVLIQAHAHKVLVKPFSADGKQLLDLEDVHDLDSASGTTASLQSGRSRKETRKGTHFMYWWLVHIECSFT